MKKIYTKKVLIGIGVIAAFILGISIIAKGIQIFNQQWHISGYSRPLGVVYASNNIELEKIYEMNGETVYTYGLTDCYVTNFWNGQVVSLSEALSNKLEMKEVLKHMDKKEADGYDWYGGENYIIVNIGDCFVILQKNMDYLSVVYELCK